jgi:hypothetical protein
VADKGFDMEKEMSTGIGLNIPPFLNGTPRLLLKMKHGKLQLFEYSHVERAIKRIKSFRIIKNVFPLKISSDLNKI